MYQNIFTQYKQNGRVQIHLWDDQLGYITFPYKKYGYVKDYSGQFVSLYGEKLKQIYQWTKEENNSVLESDIVPVTRVLVDKYTDSNDISAGHTVMCIDIEVEVTEGFPFPADANDKITSIAFHDSSVERYYCYVLDPDKRAKEKENGNVTITGFDSEYKLLNAFLRKYKEINPTIITGWNVDEFDIPYLYNRTKKICGNDVAGILSPIGVVKWNKFQFRYEIAGVSVLDYLKLYKKFTFNLKTSYQLDSISEEELGEKKIQYKGTLNDLYENDINKFIKYNINDVYLVNKLDKKLDFIDIARGVCHIGHVPYEDVFYSSRYLEGAILVHFKKLGIVAPNKNPEGKKHMTNEIGFEGAFVQDPQSGKYDWVYDLDVTSMYPSVIMSLNISPETKIGKIVGWNPKEFLKGTVKTYSLEVDGKKKETYSEKELQKLLDTSKVSISVNGILYKNDKMGLLPAILTQWFDDRVEYRNLMKKFGDAGDNEKYEYFKRRQYLQKVLLNSLYGVLGLPVFRFYDLDNARATTLTGQELIKYSKQITNHYYNKKLGTNKDYVLYIDTDSIFASAVPLLNFDVKDASDQQIINAIMDIANEVQTYLNKSYNYFSKKFLNLDVHRFEIKQEVIAKHAFFIKKKRYAMKIINESGVKVNKSLVKGLDVVRSDFPIAMREVLQTILDDILADVPKDNIDEIAINFKN